MRHVSPPIIMFIAKAQTMSYIIRATLKLVCLVIKIFGTPPTTHILLVLNVTQNYEKRNRVVN